jgi:putative phosphoribosyl transferase
MIFADRKNAGRILAQNLLLFKNNNPVILALPRGGVPVGYEVAKKLDTKLDILIVRKIGSPKNPEFGVGAIAEGGTLLIDKETILSLGISTDLLKNLIEKEKKEIERQLMLYRKGEAITKLKNKTVIIIDDGLATGVTAKCAIKAVKLQQPRKVIFAAPVCAYDTSQSLCKDTETICQISPDELQAIGSYYKDFKQVSDEDVLQILYN